jgi:Tol biopolymer transport system component
MFGIASVRGGVVAFIALALAALASSSAFAMVAPDGPRLAVVKNTLFPYRFDLETVDETGAQPLRIAGGGSRKRPLPEEFTPPSWSPDGSMMVFKGLAGRVDQGLRGMRLYVSSADGSDLRPLRGTHGADEPKFAPDGRTIFFTRYRLRPWINRQGKEEFLMRGASIWSVDALGGAPRRLTPSRNGLWMYPSSFSPDGHTLLASRSAQGESWNVVKMHLGTGRKEVFLRHASDPVYSPDGTRIAFVRWRPVGTKMGSDEWTSDLFTVRSGGGGQRRITHGPGNDLFQSWDPSGERLAFVRYPPERYDPDGLGYGSAVLQVNADGSCLSPLLTPSLDTAFFGVAWQPGPGREAGRIPC